MSVKEQSEGRGQRRAGARLYRAPLALNRGADQLALGGRLPCGFKNGHHAARLLGWHHERGFALRGEGEVAVELAPVSGESGDGAFTIRPFQCSVGGGIFVGGGDVALHEGGFLGVETEFTESGAGAAREEAGFFDGGEAGCFAHRRRTVLELQH